MVFEMSICIIPARGGSKRIKNKNLKLFNGESALKRATRLAYETKLFKRVIVSTDCANIANYTNSNTDAEVLIRDKNLADDYTTTKDVIQHVLSDQKISSDTVVCCLYTTSFFTTINDLKAANIKLITNNKKFIFAATKYRHPIQRGFNIDREGKVKNISSNYINIRTQDLEDTYHDCGQFYFGKASTWMSNKNGIICNGSVCIRLENEFVIDIDEPSDWLISERILQEDPQTTFLKRTN